MRPEAFAAALADPARRTALVERLRRLAADRGYAGLDLDFERLGPASRAELSTLVRQAAAALHADGRRLVLSVPAKTEEPGRFSNTRAFDYPALGRAADLLRLMTYGLAADAPVGPVAPLPWTDAVAAFAAQVADPAKVELGLPLGGYDWPATGRPRSITFGAAEALRVWAGASRQWDPATGSAYFRYGGRTVWYADAEAVRVRATAVTRHKLAGVALWALGEEDPAVWGALPGCRPVRVGDGKSAPRARSADATQHRSATWSRNRTGSSAAARCIRSRSGPSTSTSSPAGTPRERSIRNAARASSGRFSRDSRLTSASRTDRPAPAGGRHRAKPSRSTPSRTTCSLPAPIRRNSSAANCEPTTTRSEYSTSRLLTASDPPASGTHRVSRSRNAASSRSCANCTTGTLRDLAHAETRATSSQSLTSRASGCSCSIRTSSRQTAIRTR